MGKSLFDKIQAKLELFRLEQRYTRRRHRRSTFVSNAVYVDGEYVYQTPNSTGSSGASGASSRNDALHGEKAVTATAAPVAEIHAGPRSSSDEENREYMPSREWSQARQSPNAGSVPTAERKRLNRFSSMPGFGGSNKELPRIQERRSSVIV